jgi:hypothetical protein
MEELRLMTRKSALIAGLLLAGAFAGTQASVAAPLAAHGDVAAGAGLVETTHWREHRHYWRGRRDHRHWHHRHWHDRPHCRHYHWTPERGWHCHWRHRHWY